MKSLCNILYNNILDTINQNDLTVDVKYFIIKDVYNMLEKAYYQYLSLPERKEDEDFISEIKETNFTIENKIDEDNDIISLDENTKEIIKLGLKAKQENEKGEE